MCYIVFVNGRSLLKSKYVDSTTRLEQKESYEA